MRTRAGPVADVVSAFVAVISTRRAESLVVGQAGSGSIASIRVSAVII